MANSLGLRSLCSRLRTRELPPDFLAPALASTPAPKNQQHGFSTTAAVNARRTVRIPVRQRKDNNRHRGESALRRTGPKYLLAMMKEPLPKPVLDPARRSKVQVDPKHALWGFFNSEKQPLSTPVQDYAHGTILPQHRESTEADYLV